MIAGNGVYTLSAVGSIGHVPAGWPKLTGGWLVGTPGLGDWDGDGTGSSSPSCAATAMLLVWHTPDARQPGSTSGRDSGRTSPTPGIG